MNKKHSLYFGVAVLLLAAICTLAGCDSGGGGGGGGTTTETFTSSDPTTGTTYILVITGDRYELTIRAANGTEQKSTGAAVLGNGGAYTLTPGGDTNAPPFTVETSGNGIGGIDGPITPDGGGDPITPPNKEDLIPAMTITITGLAPYAQYGITGNGVVTRYSSSYYSPIAAGYGNISGGTAVVELKSVPSDFDFEDFDEEPSLVEVVNLIKGFPNAWTGDGSYYIMLWAGDWMVPSKNQKSFTDANPNITVLFSENDFYIE
jgi:hypothetical protein